MDGVLPKIIHSSQTGYVKGRSDIGETIRTITDIMSSTKTQNIPGLAVFLDFEKAVDSIEWNYLQKCLETFNFGPQLRQWINVIYNDISSCILNNGFATKQFNLGRGVRCDIKCNKFTFHSLVSHNVYHVTKHIGQTHLKLSAIFVYLFSHDVRKSFFSTPKHKLSS